MNGCDMMMPMLCAQRTETIVAQDETAPARSRKRWFRWTLLVIAGALAVGVVGFLVWALTPLGPEEVALEALESDAAVTVTEVDGGWLFVPSEATDDTGLVLYPGGRVDPRSYAPLARGIAEEGVTVALASMPLNLAVFDADRAEQLMGAASGVKAWAVGGHSLGGAMAAAFAAENDPRVVALVLLAAYTTESADLSSSGLAVLSALGDNDLIVDATAWEQSRALLPKDAEYLTIKGGNHAGFGNYGEQPGDGEPGIRAEEQQAATIEAVVMLFEEL